jgi:hypothetical protein
LSIFDAAWEIVYRVLRSSEGARLRAISTLGHQSRPAAKPAARIAVQSSRGLTWARFDVSVLRNGLAVSYCRFVGFPEVSTWSTNVPECWLTVQKPVNERLGNFALVENGRQRR